MLMKGVDLIRYAGQFLGHAATCQLIAILKMHRRIAIAQRGMDSLAVMQDLDVIEYGASDKRWRNDTNVVDKLGVRAASVGQVASLHVTGLGVHCQV